MPRNHGHSITLTCEDADGDQGKFLIAAVGVGDHSYRHVNVARSQFCIGVVKEPPRAAGAGEPGTIQTQGIARVKAGAAVTAGAVVTADAEGRAIPENGGDYCLGIAIESAAAADEIIDVLIDQHTT